MIEEEIAHNDITGLLFILGLLVIMGIGVYAYYIGKPKPSIKKEPHRFDGRSLQSIILELDQKIMMLEDGITGLIKRCNSIELGDKKEDNKPIKKLEKSFDEKIKHLNYLFEASIEKTNAVVRELCLKHQDPDWQKDMEKFRHSIRNHLSETQNSYTDFRGVVERRLVEVEQNERDFRRLMLDALKGTTNRIKSIEDGSVKSEGDDEEV